MPELVSIVVPTYNRGHLIGETIQSVIDQSYKNWELIIVDDGSTDDTKKRVDEFNDVRIRYYFISHTGVIGAVRNVGMSHASGNYIAFLDSDDLWLPDKLDYQLSLLRKNPESSFVFGHGEHFGTGATPTPELEKEFIGNIFIPFLFEKRFIFYVPTLLFKKEVLNKITSIDETLFYAGDIDFFLRMAYSFKGIFSHNIVTRIRKEEKSHSQNNKLNAYDDYLLMLNKHRHENRLTSKQFTQLASEHHYKLGLIYLRFEKSKKARKEFLNHIQLNPLSWKGWIRLVQSLFKSE
jgi:glycosyltransferase involved in cell wall biosynthesis